MTSPLAEQRLIELWNHTDKCHSGGGGAYDQCDCGLPAALDILINMDKASSQWLRGKAHAEHRLKIIHNVLDGHYDNG